MKILTCTDVHYPNSSKCLDEFADYAAESNPDRIMVCGDLINSAFSSMEEFLAYNQYSQKLWGWLGTTKYHIFDSPFEISRQIPIEAFYMVVEKGSFMGLIAGEYLEIIRGISKNMDRQYKEIKDKFRSRGLEDKLKVIPGNYDKFLNMSPRYTAGKKYFRNEKATKLFRKTFDHLRTTPFRNHNLDLKCLEERGIKIAGVGGANDFETSSDLIPKLIPIELTHYYDEYDPDKVDIHLKKPAATEPDYKASKSELEDKLVSRPFRFLIKEKPGIVFCHSPPHMHLDMANGRHIGSPGIKKYLDTGLARLISCGHNHGGRGVEKVLNENRDVTIVMNPGALEDGHFAEIEIDEATKYLTIRMYTIQQEELLSAIELEDVYTLGAFDEFKCITPSKERRMKDMKTQMREIERKIII